MTYSCVLWLSLGDDMTYEMFMSHTYAYCVNMENMNGKFTFVDINVGP